MSSFYFPPAFVCFVRMKNNSPTAQFVHAKLKLDKSKRRKQKTNEKRNQMKLATREEQNARRGKKEREREVVLCENMRAQECDETKYGKKQKQREKSIRKKHAKQREWKRVNEKSRPNAIAITQ